MLDGQASVVEMLRNWGVVYLGNAVGAMLVAAGCAYGGQLNYSGGQLAVFTMRLAAGKCTLPVGNAIILGILCNVLVTTGPCFCRSGAAADQEAPQTPPILPVSPCFRPFRGFSSKKVLYLFSPPYSSRTTVLPRCRDIPSHPPRNQ